jgi:hypothetical protein
MRACLSGENKGFQTAVTAPHKSGGSAAAVEAAADWKKPYESLQLIPIRACAASLSSDKFGK